MIEPTRLPSSRTTSQVGQSALSAALLIASLSEVASTCLFLSTAPPSRVNLSIRYNFTENPRSGEARALRGGDQTNTKLDMRNGSSAAGSNGWKADVPSGEGAARIFLVIVDIP